DRLSDRRREAGAGAGVARVRVSVSNSAIPVRSDVALGARARRPHFSDCGPAARAPNPSISLNRLLPLSVVIVAKNEAPNLPRCLASVQGWADEIIVALNDTVDGSEALARAAGARVHHLPWRGF